MKIRAFFYWLTKKLITKFGVIYSFLLNSIKVFILMENYSLQISTLSVCWYVSCLSVEFGTSFNPKHGKSFIFHKSLRTRLECFDQLWAFTYVHILKLYSEEEADCLPCSALQFYITCTVIVR